MHIYSLFICQGGIFTEGGVGNIFCTIREEAVFWNTLRSMELFPEQFRIKCHKGQIYRVQIAKLDPKVTFFRKRGTFSGKFIKGGGFYWEKIGGT